MDASNHMCIGSAGSSVIESTKLYLYYLIGRHFSSHELGPWRVDIHQQILFRNYGIPPSPSLTLISLDCKTADSSVGVITIEGDKYQWKGEFPEHIPTTHALLSVLFDSFSTLLKVALALLLGFLLMKKIIPR